MNIFYQEYLSFSDQQQQQHELLLFPTPIQLAADYIYPMYNETLNLIRETIHRKEVFLSFVLEEFLHFQQQLITENIDLTNGNIVLQNYTDNYGDGNYFPYLIVIVGCYKSSTSQVLHHPVVRHVELKYLLKCSRLIEHEHDTLGDDVFLKAFFDSLVNFD